MDCPGQIDEIFRITKNKLSTGNSCEYTDGSRRKFSDCRDYCPVNCTGIYDSNWSGCTVVCDPVNADNPEPTKIIYIKFQAF